MTTDAHRLTRYSTGGGCACKMPQGLLAQIIDTARGGSTGHVDQALLVGLDAPDDAAVYVLDENRALVITCDFLTPVVDEPEAWGRIAAANALSDVYAMGGRPLLALNVLGWPEDLPHTLLQEVLRGGAGAVLEAGALLVGGHSIVDQVPTYGLAVVGDVHPDQVVTKGGGHAGDLLVLTKPLGTGVLGTAVKRGHASSGRVRAAVASMTRLNATASRVATEAGVRGGTDVTGYGLIGHLHEMALAAGLEARIWADAVPTLPGIDQLATDGNVPDGTRRTLDNARREGWFDPAALGETDQLLLADAQTSGGLLLAVPPPSAHPLVERLHAEGDEHAAIVGELADGSRPGQITLGR